MDLAIGTQQRKAHWLAPVAASCRCTSPHWTEKNMDGYQISFIQYFRCINSNVLYNKKKINQH